MELGNLQKSAQWGEFLLLAVQNAGIVNVVNLAESRNTSVSGLQPHLLGIILIVLIKVGRTAHCGWYRSLDGTLGCRSGKRELHGPKHS